MSYNRICHKGLVVFSNERNVSTKEYEYIERTCHTKESVIRVLAVEPAVYPWNPQCSILVGI